MPGRATRRIRVKKKKDLQIFVNEVIHYLPNASTITGIIGENLEGRGERKKKEKFKTNPRKNQP